MAWRLLCLPLKYTFSPAEDNLLFFSYRSSFSNNQMKNTYYYFQQKMNKNEQENYFNIHIMAIHMHERCLLLLFFIKCLLQLYSCVNNTWTLPGLWRSVTSSLKKWFGSYKGPKSSSILLPNKHICLAEWSYQVIHFFTKKSDFEVER